jgi:hypothetical protein
MFNVCLSCGAYRDAKIVAGPSSICPACGASAPCPQHPLCILSGASGTGKSTVCHRLLAEGIDAVVLDSDILWSEEFHPRSQWPKYFNLWLRLCKSILLSGRPVLLAGAGFGVPANLEQCVEYRYFRRVHILALVCDDLLLARRLNDRPAWRGSADPAFVDDHIRYNRWFRRQGARADAPLITLDTTNLAPHTVADAVAQWLQHCICHPDPLACAPLAVTPGRNEHEHNVT